MVAFGSPVVPEVNSSKKARSGQRESSPVEPGRADNLPIDVRDDVVVVANQTDAGCGRGVRFAAMSWASVTKNTP
jgi:hypothetical protein